VVHDFVLLCVVRVIISCPMKNQSDFIEIQIEIAIEIGFFRFLKPVPALRTN